jgi:hypothetical protein
MIMRSFPVTIIVILLLTSACLISACLSDKTAGLAANTTPVSAEPTQLPYISFENARDQLGIYADTDPRTNPDMVTSYIRKNENITIRLIQGTDIDMAGNARVWTFGVQKENGNELRAYDRSGWTILPLNESFSSGEIVLDRIITPGALFTMNKDAISQAASSDSVLHNVELKDGIYEIAFRGKPRILRFNATTGASIDPNT